MIPWPANKVRLLRRRLVVDLPRQKKIIINSYNPYQFAICEAGLWQRVEQVLQTAAEADHVMGMLGDVPGYARHQSQEFLHQLLNKQLLVEENYDEGVALERLQQSSRAIKRLGPIYLIPTMGCNFRCPHCLFYSGKLGMSRSGDALETKTLDLFLRALSRDIDQLSETTARLRFIFYGGEPLMRPDIILNNLASIRHAAQNGFFGKRPISFLLLTNGSLISEPIAKLIKREQVSVGVSLDGLEEYNYLHRRAASKTNGAFAQVIDGISRLESAGVTYGLSITLSSRNIMHAPELLRWVAENLETRTISINLMRCFSDEPYVDRDAELMLGHLDAVYSSVRELGFVDQRLSRYQYLKYDEPYRYFCGAAGGTQLVLMPDGRISSCHGDIAGSDSQFDEIRKCGDLGQAASLSRWKDIVPLFMRHCIDTCPFYSICSSGCPRNAGSSGPDTYVPSASSCAIERYYMTRGIQEMLHVGV